MTMVGKELKEHGSPFILMNIFLKAAYSVTKNFFRKKYIFFLNHL